MSQMHEELEVGHELDRVVRTAVTAVAQMMERVSRRATDRDRADTTAARDAARQADQQTRDLTRQAESAQRDAGRKSDMAQRDVTRKDEMAVREQQQSARRELMEQTGAARGVYGPWTYEGKVERGDRVAASVAWSRAAAWSEQDPRARDAEQNLNRRIQDTFGAHPADILGSINPEHGHPTGVAAGRMTVKEAAQLSEQYGPFYYEGTSADMFGRISNRPLNPLQERFVADWQEWAQTGSLPHDTLVRSWARHVGDAAALTVATFADDVSVIDRDARTAALEQVWEDGREQRDLEGYERHLADLEAAQLSTDPAKVPTVEDLGRPQVDRSWEPMLADGAVRQATGAEAVTAWRSAVTAAAADPADHAARAAAEQLSTQIATVHGVDVATYLADAVHDQEVVRTDGRRRVQDMARDTREAREDSTAALHTSLQGASKENPVPAVNQVGLDMPVHVTSAPFESNGAWFVGINGDTFTPLSDLAAPTKDGLGYQPNWVTDAGMIDAAAFSQAVREARGVSGDETAPDESNDRESSVDVDAARTVAPEVQTAAVDVGADRGVAPSKAKTPQEREHRVAAWRQVEQEFGATLPEGTTSSQARAAWDGLPVSDRFARYWKVYDGKEAAEANREQAPDNALAPERPAEAKVEQPVAEEALPRERVVQLNTVAAQWYSDQLQPGTAGHKYLTGRLGADAVQSGPWALGYAPDGWNGLARQLRSQAGATDQEIVAAGLGRVSSRGTVIDAFRNRAMVAVKDTDGEVVGFYGRDLTGNDRNPKHLNTAGTSAFTKGDHVFGLHEVPAGARVARTEAAFDAIALTQASDGQLWGVAPMGTSMTGTQAAAIAGQVGERGQVWLANDGDSAGQRATETDFWRFVENGVDPRQVTLPAGQDPAGLWASNPDLLRTFVQYPDTHPSAALQVLEHAIDTERAGLLAGEADAFDRIDMTERDLTGALRNDVDQAFLSSQTHSLLTGLREEQAAAQVEAARLEDTEAQLTDQADRYQDDPERRDDLSDAASAVDAREDTARGRAGELAGQVNQAGAEDKPYNRADESDIQGLSPAAQRVAIGTAHGYSRSTTDMLNAATKGSDEWKAKQHSPAAGPSQQRTKGSRR